MVTTDISQLTTECNTWKTNLRNFREQLTQSKHLLEKVASRQISRNALQDIEHYDNQFHIQLINIHDLKQAIKENERTAGWERNSEKGITDAVWTKHEDLYQQYQQLEHTLQDLKTAFEQFLDQTKREL